MSIGDPSKLKPCNVGARMPTAASAPAFGCVGSTAPSTETGCVSAAELLELSVATVPSLTALSPPLVDHPATPRVMPTTAIRATHNQTALCEARGKRDAISVLLAR